ncbi:MAG: thymidylate synthase ThyX [bacterium]|nr:thymidylate synthase ThyX [bacterium]
MKIKYLGTKGTWREVADSANTTINREAGTKEPSSSWKRRLLLSEHSPIRQLFIKAKWYDLKYWVSVHIVRHKIGIEHWVRTQRTDRTETDRDTLPQANTVEHEILANTQAIIAISRKRLCTQASKETQDAWKSFLEVIKEEQPELHSICVPDCIYRGWCYEYKSCGYHKTAAFREDLDNYRQGINE